MDVQHAVDLSAPHQLGRDPADHAAGTAPFAEGRLGRCADITTDVAAQPCIQQRRIGKAGGRDGVLVRGLGREGAERGKTFASPEAGRAAGLQLAVIVPRHRGIRPGRTSPAADAKTGTDDLRGAESLCHARPASAASSQAAECARKSAMRAWTAPETGSDNSAPTSAGSRSSKVRWRSAPSSAVRSRTLVQR